MMRALRRVLTLAMARTKTSEEIFSRGLDHPTLAVGHVHKVVLVFKGLEKISGGSWNKNLNEEYVDHSRNKVLRLLGRAVDCDEVYRVRHR